MLGLSSLVLLSVARGAESIKQKLAQVNQEAYTVSSSFASGNKTIVMSSSVSQTPGPFCSSNYAFASMIGSGVNPEIETAAATTTNSSWADSYDITPGDGDNIVVFEYTNQDGVQTLSNTPTAGAPVITVIGSQTGAGSYSSSSGSGAASYAEGVAYS